MLLRTINKIEIPSIPNFIILLNHLIQLLFFYKLKSEIVLSNETIDKLKLKNLQHL